MSYVMLCYVSYFFVGLIFLHISFFILNAYYDALSDAFNSCIYVNFMVET